MNRRSRYTFAFAIEQVLGHITHADNLRLHVPADPNVDAHWVLPRYPVDGLASHVPLYRSNWTLRSGLGVRRGLRDIAREVSPDAIFFHTQVTAMLSPDWVRRVPSVISVDATPRQYDELGPFYRHETGPDVIEKLKARAARNRFEQAAHVVTWSSWAKRGLVDDYGVPAEKITVVPPGVTVADWSRPRPDTRAARPVRVLFVGGDLERKGGLILLDAFRSVRHLGVELHVATRDDVPAEDGVHVHRGLEPNSDELRRLYADCDVFALPTYGDCLPMVLSEAGASGLATISTNVAAIPEVVIDETTGLLVRPGDTDGLSAALRRLVENPVERRRMGEQAVGHIARHYDTKRNTEQLLDIMKRVADHQRRTG